MIQRLIRSIIRLIKGWYVSKNKQYVGNYREVCHRGLAFRGDDRDHNHSI